MSAGKLIFAVSALSLSACASLPKTQETAPQMATKSSGLSARNLTAGECGFFVWTADAQKRFILFGQSQKARADWFSSAGETQLTVNTKSGVPTQGQYPKQVYRAQNSEIMLDLREPQTIEDGTRYRAGTLTQNDANGWTRVTPIVGLSACKPRDN